MKYVKDRPIGIWILAIFIVLFEIYYFSRPLIWGGNSSSYPSILTFTPWAFFVWFNLLLEIILLYAVIIGFYKAKNWARLYTIALISYSSFWNLYLLLIVRVWPYERFAWFVFYIIIILYLMIPHVREYFGVKKLFI